MQNNTVSQEPWGDGFEVKGPSRQMDRYTGVSIDNTILLYNKTFSDQKFLTMCRSSFKEHTPNGPGDVDILEELSVCHSTWQGLERGEAAEDTRGHSETSMETFGALVVITCTEVACADIARSKENVRGGGIVEKIKKPINLLKNQKNGLCLAMQYACFHHPPRGGAEYWVAPAIVRLM